MSRADGAADQAARAYCRSIGVDLRLVKAVTIRLEPNKQPAVTLELWTDDEQPLADVVTAATATRGYP
jgi:hypothetical protein